MQPAVAVKCRQPLLAAAVKLPPWLDDPPPAAVKLPPPPPTSVNEPPLALDARDVGRLASRSSLSTRSTVLRLMKR